MDLRSAWESEGEFIERTVGSMAREFAKAMHLPPDDIEDIKQELRMDLWRRLPSFKEEKAGLRTFITLLVRNKIENIRQHLIAGKRDVGKVAYSLDEELFTSDGTTICRLDFLTVEAIKDANFRWALPEEQILDLRIDIRAALGGLTEKQRSLCRLICSGYTVSEISGQLNVSRSVIYERLKALRERFKKL